MTKAVAPEASPSRPSVRLTALLHAEMSRYMKSKKNTMPKIPPPNARSTVSKSRRKLRWVDPGVSPTSLGNNRIIIPNASAMTNWPMSLAFFIQTQIRCLTSLM